VEAGYLAYHVSLIDFSFVLSQHFNALDLCLPMTYGEDDRARNKLELPPHRVRIVQLPFYFGLDTSPGKALRRFVGAFRLVWQQSASWDLVGCVLPNVIGIAFAIAARLRRKPLFLIVRGNRSHTVKHAVAGPYWKKQILGWAAEVMEIPCRYLIRQGVPTFVFGEQLVTSYGRYGSRVFPLRALLHDSLGKRPETKVQARDRLTLIYVGRLSGEKGVADLLEATRIIRNRLPDRAVRLRIVGDGPQSVELQLLASRLGLNDAVEFIGGLSFGPQLFELYAAADIFVLPSYTEGLPGVLLEAMALGVPVVATRVGGIPQLIVEGQNGLLVDPQIPDRLADAICRIAVSPELWSALREGGFETAPHYSYREAARAMIASLRSIYPQLAWRNLEDRKDECVQPS
jgi:glycosyltransferase involved in cell wall biosynthesis